MCDGNMRFSKYFVLFKIKLKKSLFLFLTREATAKRRGHNINSYLVMVFVTFILISLITVGFTGKPTGHMCNLTEMFTCSSRWYGTIYGSKLKVAYLYCRRIPVFFWEWPYCDHYEWFHNSFLLFLLYRWSRVWMGLCEKKIKLNKNGMRKGTFWSAKHLYSEPYKNDQVMGP